MTASERYYRVAGLAFAVELESPWAFMRYTAPVEERIRRAAAGDVVAVMPTRAGDGEPPRTYVQSRSELPEDYSGRVLDFSQYEPFAADRTDDVIFRLKVCAGTPDSFEKARLAGQAVRIMSMTDVLPYYHVYAWNGGTVFQFEGNGGAADATLFVDGTAGSGLFWAREGLNPYSVVFEICFALRIMYTYNSMKYGAVLMHSSVIVENGSAVMFLGTSGTGKSTHSRLWLENIPGAELLNDDNPVIRLENGMINVYGSPWSGKTPCYRNAHAPVRAMVRLFQAPENSARRLKGLEAFTNIISSASTIKWDRKVMDGVMSVISAASMNLTCLCVNCLPDRDAAEMCCRETVK